MNFFLNRYKKLGKEINPNSVEVRRAIRVNTLKIPEEELVQRLKKRGIGLTKIPFTKNGYYVNSKFSVGSTAEYLQGFYYIQDTASQLPAEVLSPKKTDTVLDMCAAPGGKTTYLAQIMENNGKIIALDITSKRLDSLRNNLNRCGVSNTIIYNKDARFIDDFNIKFDKILLDAPCSGNFTIDKEWFNKRDIPDIMDKSKIQKELIKSALNVLKSKGTLVYSTCSLEPEENEAVIDWALNNFDIRLEKINITSGEKGITNLFNTELSSQIEKTKRFWPDTAETIGFFIAKIKMLN